MRYNKCMFYEVILGKIFGKGAGVLTYASDDSLLAGQIVEVPLGRGKTVGVVNKKVAQPDFETRPISQILYAEPLPKHLVATMKFIADYYQVPLAQALGVVLPSGVVNNRGKRKAVAIPDRGSKKTEQNRTKPNKTSAASVKTEQKSGFAEKTLKIPLIPLNTAQKKALEGLQNASSATKLLLGLTGSGKTNIYLSEAARALSAQKSVIVLVPEIALTSQLVRVFEETFGKRVVLMHSKQTVKERREIWEGLLMGKEPKIVIGPRSALFAPLKDLGLIIIDEEHEPAYTQENAPRYSAVRVASFMARELTISCILGSATPNLADFYLAKQRGAVVTLTEKALKGAKRPEVRLIDLKKREDFSKNRYFSNALIRAIKENLAAGRQTLIFHNRRGSAPLTICDQCGKEILCPNCYLPLTLHADRYELVCHTCDFRTQMPTACPECGAVGLVHKGFGTKLLEAEIGKLFPEARVRRFDADNRKGETLAAAYEAVRDGEVDIMVGTQTVAKGLDLPRLATVGVVQADAGLSLPDYAAEERTFQLITQVMGRVGRGHLDAAEVIIQTFRPEHPIFGFAMAEDYQGFAEYLLAKRRASGFPPYRFVAVVSVTLKTERLVVKKVRELAARLGEIEGLMVSPPQPAFHEHTSRGYTWQVVVRAKSRKKLVEAVAGLEGSFRVTLDPVSLL